MAPETAKELVKRVNEIYHSDTIPVSPDQNKAVEELYEKWIKDKPFSSNAKKLLHTQYHNRNKVAESRTALMW